MIGWLRTVVRSAIKPLEFEKFDGSPETFPLCPEGNPFEEYVLLCRDGGMRRGVLIGENPPMWRAPIDWEPIPTADVVGWRYPIFADVH